MNFIKFYKQGGLAAAGDAIGRRGSEILIEYHITSGERRQRFIKKDRVIEFAGDFDELPRYVRRKCKASGKPSGDAVGRKKCPACGGLIAPKGAYYQSGTGGLKIVEKIPASERVWPNHSNTYAPDGSIFG